VAGTAHGARDGLLRQLHSLRGAAGTVGAAALQSEAAQVETLLHAGRPDAVLDQAVAGLHLQLSQLVQQLRAALPAEVAVA
jgi:two-component system sensor histidine kinase/response regulator